MADLKNLTSDAKRLYEALEYLLDRQSQENEDEIDFKEICFSAKSRPFVNHTINRLDESEVNNYLLILAGLIAICDDSDKKKMQIRVLARIMAGYYKNEIPLQDIINRGKMLQEDNIDELQQIYNKDALMFLLIDLLIMVYLDDSISEKQLDYVIEMIACIGLDRE